MSTLPELNQQERQLRAKIQEHHKTVPLRDLTKHMEKCEICNENLRELRALWKQMRSLRSSKGDLDGLQPE